MMLRIAGLFAICTSLAACNGAANDGEQQGVIATPAAAATVATEAPGQVAAPAPQQPTGPAQFIYSGEMTQGGWIKGQVPAGTVSARLGEQVLTVDQSGNFFAAFDRDAGTSAQLTAQLASGETRQSALAISPRQWNIQRVNVAKRGGGSSEAWWKKREPEWLAIKAARAKVTNADGWRQDFIWPVKGRISGKFGRQRIYRGEPGSYHSGLDIAPGNGVPFVSPADGVVVLARTGFSLEGGLIIIDHGAGLNSAFLHASKLGVREGQSVKQGQYIGNVGSTGRSTGPHLHWGLKWNDARIDPLLFVGPQ
ncbi:MAG: M23 family metallopeptidase [Erythrobacter sp.]